MRFGGVRQPETGRCTVQVGVIEAGTEHEDIVTPQIAMWRKADFGVRTVLGCNGLVYRMGDRWVLANSPDPWDLSGLEVRMINVERFDACLLDRNGRSGPTYGGRTAMEAVRWLQRGR